MAISSPPRGAGQAVPGRQRTLVSALILALVAVLVLATIVVVLLALAYGASHTPHNTVH